MLSGVPETDGRVLRAGSDQRAVRAKSDAGDPGRMPAENGHGFVRRHVPQPDRSVEPDRGERRTIGETHIAGGPVVADKLGMALLCGDAPESHGPGGTPGGDKRSVGTEREAAIAPPGSGGAGPCALLLPEATFQSVTPTSRAAVAIRVRRG